MQGRDVRRCVAEHNGEIVVDYKRGEGEEHEEVRSERAEESQWIRKCRGENVQR